MRRIASFYRLFIALSVIALVALSVFSLPSPYYEKFAVLGSLLAKPSGPF